MLTLLTICLFATNVISSYSFNSYTDTSAIKFKENYNIGGTIQFLNYFHDFYTDVKGREIAIMSYSSENSFVLFDINKRETVTKFPPFDVHIVKHTSLYGSDFIFIAEKNGKVTILKNGEILLQVDSHNSNFPNKVSVATCNEFVVFNFPQPNGNKQHIFKINSDASVSDFKNTEFKDFNNIQTILISGKQYILSSQDNEYNTKQIIHVFTFDNAQPVAKLNFTTGKGTIVVINNDVFICGQTISKYQGGKLVKTINTSDNARNAKSLNGNSLIYSDSFGVHVLSTNDLKTVSEHVYNDKGHVIFSDIGVLKDRVVVGRLKSITGGPFTMTGYDFHIFDVDTVFSMTYLN